MVDNAAKCISSGCKAGMIYHFCTARYECPVHGIVTDDELLLAMRGLLSKKERMMRGKLSK
jgi:hypothetical protein